MNAWTELSMLWQWAWVLPDLRISYICLKMKRYGGLLVLSAPFSPFLAISALRYLWAITTLWLILTKKIIKNLIFFSC